MLNICRANHEASGTHCWRVTVQRRTRLFVRTFSDGPHGGSQAALEAAIAYRDTLTTTHPPLELPAHYAILKRPIDRASRG